METNETNREITRDDILAALDRPRINDGYHVPITVWPEGYLRGHPQEAILSTQHAASSYGLPVLVCNGTAYGPADLPGLRLRLIPYLADAARLAGWTVDTVYPDDEDGDDED